MRGAGNPDARPIRLLKRHRNVMRLQSSAASNGEEHFPFICLPETPPNTTITFAREEQGGTWQRGAGVPMARLLLSHGEAPQPHPLDH